MIDIDDDALARALRTVEVGGYATTEQLRARAHQVRTRRRLAAAGVTAAVTAAAAVAVVLPSAMRDGAEPPVVDQPAPLEPDVVLDLDTLARGPEPLVPWYEPSGMLRFGSEQSPHVIESADPVLRRVDGGFLVWESDDGWPEQTLVFVPGNQGGNSEEIAAGLISQPVVSPDGTRVAWGVSDPEWTGDQGDRPGTDFTSTLVLADAATGEVLAELPGVPGPTTSPVSFLGDGTILVSTGGNTVSAVSTWEPGEGLTPYRDETEVEALSPTGDLLALTGAGGSDVVDVASGETLWTLRDASPLAFSPDGRYLAVATEPVNGWVTPEDLATARPGDVIADEGHEVTVTQELLDLAARYPDGWEHIDYLVIHDARTGAEVLRIEGELGEISPVWESGASIVFEAYQDRTEAALVRCTVGATCELATEPAALDDNPDTNDNPYVLGR